MDNFKYLYGIYLLASFVCIFIVISNYLFKDWVEWKRNLTAFIIILAIFFFQDAYRNEYSSQAIAQKAFDDLLDKWEYGNKQQVIINLNRLSLDRPWVSSEPHYDRD